MPISFDTVKNAWTVAQCGLSFELVDEFSWDTVQVFEDERKDYGELRLQLWGLISGRLHIAVVTPRGNDLRLISLRKANTNEVKRYGKD